MQGLFGLNSRDYTRLRRLFGVPPAVGRPPEPDEDLAHNVWAVVSAHAGRTGRGKLTAADYLEIAERSGASLRVVWQLTQRWAEDGDLSAGSLHPTHSHTGPAGIDDARMSNTGS